MGQTEASLVIAPYISSMTHSELMALMTGGMATVSGAILGAYIGYGAIRRDFSPGDLVVISDHINLSGDNPLSGPNLNALGERFPDMTHAYYPDLREAALEAGRQLGLEVKQEVYVCVKGPSYETPAEIRMLSALGADVVGMSTVPEVISLNHMRCRVVGISCITNMAAGPARIVRTCC